MKTDPSLPTYTPPNVQSLMAVVLFFVRKVAILDSMLAGIKYFNTLWNDR